MGILARRCQVGQECPTYFFMMYRDLKEARSLLKVA